MEIVKKYPFLASIRGFFLLGHPLPVFLHGVAVTVFALLAGWPHIALGLLLLVVAAHVAMQLSIAVLNDYCDRHIDALSQKNKPIPQGLVTPRAALIYGLLLILLLLLLLLPLNRLALLISLLYLAFGQAYNLGLKSTPFSGIVFALAIPLIPIYAFAGMNHLVPLVFWIIPVAALLGIAINLANSLPDIEEDAASGARTLAVVLGLQRSFFLVTLLIFASIVCILLLTLAALVPVRLAILIPTLLVTLVLAGALLLLFGPSKPVYTRKRYFFLVVLTCLILGGGWIIGAL